MLSKSCGSVDRRSVALLVSRLIIGGIFISSGWAKVSDITSTLGFFGQLGIPAFLAYVVAYLELVGGIMIVLGFYTCLAAAVLAVIMIFAVWFTRSMGFQGMGLPLAALAALLALCGTCGGKYSLKRGCCGKGACCGAGGSDKCCDSGTCEAK